MRPQQPKVIHYRPEWSAWMLNVFEDGVIYRFDSPLPVPLSVTVDDKHTHTVSVRYREEHRVKNGFATKYCKIPVGTLILEAFEGPRPSSKHKACHKNDNPADNSRGNLYWGEEKEQGKDRRNNLGCNFRPKAAYVNPWIYDALREYHRQHFPAQDLGRDCRALIEIVLETFLADKWPEWKTWATERRKNRDS